MCEDEIEDRKCGFFKKSNVAIIVTVAEEETDNSVIYGAPNRQTERADTKTRNEETLKDETFSVENL